MDSDQIRAEIDAKIKLGSPSREVGYAVFIKPDDPESDCLMKFVEDNDISARIVDISTDEGFYIAIMECGLMECDVPCIYSIKEDRVVYYGCPEYVEELER